MTSDYSELNGVGRLLNGITLEDDNQQDLEEQNQLQERPSYRRSDAEDYAEMLNRPRQEDLTTAMRREIELLREQMAAMISEQDELKQQNRQLVLEKQQAILEGAQQNRAPANAQSVPDIREKLYTSTSWRSGKSMGLCSVPGCSYEKSRTKTPNPHNLCTKCWNLWNSKDKREERSKKTRQAQLEEQAKRASEFQEKFLAKKKSERPARIQAIRTHESNIKSTTQEIDKDHEEFVKEFMPKDAKSN